MNIALALWKIVALVAGLLTGSATRALVQVNDKHILTLDLIQCLGERQPLASNSNQQASTQASFEQRPA
jgi:hypothetical protein